jgi:hypothetical protein
MLKEVTQPLVVLGFLYTCIFLYLHFEKKNAEMGRNSSAVTVNPWTIYM